MRFTINEYATAYSISPEMVQSRLRRNRLNYIVENDTTYIVVPKHQVPYNTNEDEASKTQNSPTSKRTTVATVIGLYQKENHYLKLKIEELEAKVDSLVKDKEQLLKDERIRIEKIYTDKDSQLKTILELVNTKLLQESQGIIERQGHEPQEKTRLKLNPKLETKHTGLTELKTYLRTLGLKSGVRKTIKRRFAAAFGEDHRVLLKNGMFYLDFDRYDYSDLLKGTYTN